MDDIGRHVQPTRRGRPARIRARPAPAARVSRTRGRGRGSGKVAWRVARTARSTGLSGLCPMFHGCTQIGSAVGGQVAHPAGGGAAQRALHVVEPLLGHGRVDRHRHVRGDGGQVGPRARHDLDELVAAAAERDPPAGRRLVREVVQRLVGAALGVDGDGQVGERVVHVGVAAVLADEHLGGEGPHERRHDRLDRAQPGGVAGARRQGDVGDRAARRRARRCRPASRCRGRGAGRSRAPRS